MSSPASGSRAIMPCAYLGKGLLAHTQHKAVAIIIFRFGGLRIDEVDHWGKCILLLDRMGRNGSRRRKESH